MQYRTLSLICAVWLLLSSFGSNSIAQLVDWTNASGDSNWFNPANWSTGTVPSSTDQPFLGTQGLTHGGLVDLDGRVASIQSLGVYSGTSATGYTVGNGTLVLDQLGDSNGTSDGTQTPNWITANVTTNGGTLNLAFAQVSGVIGGSGGAGRNDFSVSGTGFLTGANTYSGTTLAGTYGPLVFAGLSGSAANSSAIDLIGTLHLDNTAAVNTNRLSSAAPISSDSGTFIYEGNANAASQESFGVFGLNTGASQLTVVSHGPGAVASFQALGHVAGTTLNLTLSQPTSSLSGQVLIRDASSVSLIGGSGAAGSNTVSILPFAVSPGPKVSFVTNDPGADGIFGTADDVGLRPLDVSTEYSPAINSGTRTTENVRLTTAQTVPENTTINSLVVSGATLTVAAGKQLSITSGAVALDASSSIPSVITGGSQSALAFASNPAIFHVVTPWPPNTLPLVDLPITGTGGLVKSGLGGLLLTHPNSYLGGTYINQGELISGAQGALSSGPITVSSATLGFASQNQTVSNNITFNSSLSIDAADATQATLIGQISGTGSIVLTGNGTVRFTGPISITDWVSQPTNAGGALYLDGITTARAVRGEFLLGGTGEIHAPVFIEGENPILAPGDGGPGVLTVQSIQENALNAPVYRFELDGTQAGTGYSQLVIEDATQVFSLFANLQLVLGYAPHVGDSFTIVRNLSGQPWNQTFNKLPEGTIFTADSQEFQITYHGGAGNDIVVTAVPEPAAIGMLGFGLALLCRRSPRRRAIR